MNGAHVGLCGPLQAPRSPAVAAGFWGAPVAGLTLPTANSCDSLTQASSWPCGSGIGASSAVPVAKLGVADWRGL